MMLGTFHSICHRLLRIHAPRAGLDKNFQILDAQDQLAFIRRLLREHNINEERHPPREVRSYITIAKERGRRAAVARDMDAKNPLSEIYQYYEAACRRENKLDFSELILAVMELLHAHDDLRRHYAGRFRYILVDELQDTNWQQFEWLSLMDAGDNHFFAVGDDDQSIYAFRGAEPDIMRKFQSRLRAAKLIRLEENYRSAKNILDAANAVIRHNRDRLGKTLFTAAAAGAPVQIIPAPSDGDEARMVARQLADYLAGGGAPEQAAVLYRTNAQSRLLERALMEEGIAYRVYGGLRFFDRQEIKHALAYLRLQAGDDLDALARVINMPPRGIGAKTLAGLAAADNPFAALAHATNRNLAAFNLLLGDLRRHRAPQTLAQMVETVLEKSGLLAYYTERKEEERLENLGELLSAAVQFEENYDAQSEEDVLLAFLSTAALESGGEGAAGGAAAVCLMTVHAAKGLEFQRVLIVGMEEGMFPHANSLQNDRQLEEERRLLYVAMTRARRQLSLHFAGRRIVYGKPSLNPPSRFLNELPPECLEDADWRFKLLSPPIKQAGGQRHAPPAIMGRQAESMLPSPPNVRADSDGYRVGDFVLHPRYGKGVVLRRRGGGSDEQIEVAFKNVGSKLFKAALAKLKKV